MRPLNISKQPTDSAWEADYAQALPLLRQLAAAQPLGLPAAAEEHLLQSIIAIARQYRAQKVAWEDLLRAGYTGAAKCVAHGHEVDRWLTWWVRQEMAKLLP